MKKMLSIFASVLLCISLFTVSVFAARPVVKRPPQPKPPKKPQEKIERCMPENKMIPGRKTVKNFLLTSLAPTGKVLWVTGGGWNYNDTGADKAARTIGMSKKWINFFNSEDADYSCDDTEPILGKNVCHEKGLDCVGHVGWSIYNTLYSKSLAHKGFVGAPDRMVKYLKKYCTFESADDLAGKTAEEIVKSLRPGDFAIMPGRHMYIVVGTCSDGSMLILHSATNTSVTGANGGGVQLSAVSKGGTTDCEAYKLALKYMAKYPKWTSRYSVLAKDYAVYTNFYNYDVDSESNGIFHWKKSALRDPDKYYKKSAGQIMKNLYK